MFSDFNRFVSVTPQENRRTQSSGSLPGWFSVLSSAFQLPIQAFICCQCSFSCSVCIQETLIFHLSHVDYFCYLNYLYYQGSIFHCTWLACGPLNHLYSSLNHFYYQGSVFHLTRLARGPLCIPAFFSSLLSLLHAKFLFFLKCCDVYTMLVLQQMVLWRKGIRCTIKMDRFEIADWG